MTRCGALLQLARRWAHMQEIALTFDDLTEGHYAKRLLPFLEQAQQKLHASKWADGKPLPQVSKRVADLRRDESACVEAITACRKAIHALEERGELLGRGQQLAQPADVRVQEGHRRLRRLHLGAGEAREQQRHRRVEHLDRAAGEHGRLRGGRRRAREAVPAVEQLEREHADAVKEVRAEQATRLKGGDEHSEAIVA